MPVRQRHTLRRLFGYTRPYRGRMAWAIVGMIVYAIGTAGLPYLIKPIFNDVLPRQQDVSFVAWAIVAVFLLKGVGSFVSSYLMAGVGQRVVMDLRNALYRHILNQSAGFFAHGATGRLLSRINNDVSQVQQVVSDTIADLARESLAVVGLSALLFYYDARLTIVFLTGAPLVVYPLIRLGQRVRRTTRRSQEAIEQLSHLSTEAFTGHRIVKAFATEGHEADKFNRAGDHLFRTNMKVTAALSSLPPLMELIGGIGMAAAIVYGSSQIAQHRLDTGAFALFMSTLLLMYGPAKKLSRVNADLQQAIAAIGAHLRDARHPHGGGRGARRRAAGPVHPRHRVPRRGVRLRGRLGSHPAQRLAAGARRPDDRDRRPQRRRQDHAGEPAAALLRRERGRNPDRWPSISGR